MGLGAAAAHPKIEIDMLDKTDVANKSFIDIDDSVHESFPRASD